MGNAMEVGGAGAGLAEEMEERERVGAGVAAMRRALAS